MIITRRNLLRSLLAAPAIIAVERLMPVKALLVPEPVAVTINGKSWQVEFSWTGKLLSARGAVPDEFVGVDGVSSKDIVKPWDKPLDVGRFNDWGDLTETEPLS